MVRNNIKILKKLVNKLRKFKCYCRVCIVWLDLDLEYTMQQIFRMSSIKSVILKSRLLQKDYHDGL